MSKEQAFPCPFPGCARSFPELWKLRAHYRAPIRNAPGRGGHGEELPSCPRCREELAPMLPHLGCTGGLAAPKQAAKRRRQHLEEDRRIRQASSLELSPLVMGGPLSLDRTASSSVATNLDFGGCLATPPQAASPTGSGSAGMIVPMSMGSYDGMPAASDPRRKPLEHLVTAFLQAVMRVQNKQQQGPAEHFATAQYDSESSGGCKTPPIIEQQQLQQLQWGSRNGSGTPTKMAESAAGSPVRGIRTASTSSAEETAMVLGAATGSSEWTAETLLQQCRDAASQPGVSGDGHAEVVGAMMSALDGLQQQQGQQQMQQQDTNAQWTQQQLQPFEHVRADSFHSEPPRSLQQQALARDTTTMLADWHAEQSAAGRGFERQRSGSAPLPVGAGRWQHNESGAYWAPRPPQPLHCSGGILDTSLAGHWQPQQQQQAAADPHPNFIADFASMPSVPLLAHTDPLWDALQQHEGPVTVEAPPQQLAYSQPPVQQPATGCQPERAPGPLSTTGWAAGAPGDAYQGWTPADHIVPQQAPRPACGGCNSWATCCIETSGAETLYPSALPASLTPPGPNAFAGGPGGSCGDLMTLQDASAPWQHRPTEMYGNAMMQPTQEVL